MRVGIIGLGRQWRNRYRPALEALADQYAIVGVYNQVANRVEREPRAIRRGRTSSPTALLERDNVEAILLLDRQWFGLWPLDAACRLKKPVFAAVSLDVDEQHADRLHARVSEFGVPVMMAMVPHILPVTTELRQLLDTRSGPSDSFNAK